MSDMKYYDINGNEVTQEQFTSMYPTEEAQRNVNMTLQNSGFSNGQSAVNAAIGASGAANAGTNAAGSYKLTRTVQNSADAPYQSPVTQADKIAATNAQAPDYSLNYQPTEVGQAYTAAMQKISQDLKTGKPAYENKWDAELENSYKAIVNRPAFDYNPDSDPFYKQYEQRYTDLGQRAMRDTIAQAAALTGGYGNTYGQYAGQESYNAYMAALADKALELEDRAYQRYQDEGNRLYQNFQMAGAMSDTAYGRWRDQVSDYNQALALAQAYEAENYQRAVQEHEYDILAEQTGYSRGRDALSDLRYEDELAYSRWRDMISDDRYEEEFAYQKERDAVADDQWAQEFGFKVDQANAKAAGSSGSSGGGGGGGSSSGGYSAETATLQQRLNAMGANLDVDGICGPLTEAAYNKYMGGTGSSASNLQSQLMQMNNAGASYQEMKDYGTAYQTAAGKNTEYARWLAEAIKYGM